MKEAATYISAELRTKTDREYKFESHQTEMVFKLPKSRKYRVREKRGKDKTENL